MKYGEITRNYGRGYSGDVNGRWVATLLISIACACITACSSDTPSTPSSSRHSFRRMALFAAHRTLNSHGVSAEARTRSELANDLRSLTGAELFVIDPGDAHDRNSAVFEAAVENAALLIYIQHPGGVPDGFVTAEAIDVVTGERFGDTSAERNSETRVNSKVLSWFRENFSSWGGSKEFHPKEFVQRLKKGKRCNQVVDFSNRFNPLNDSDRLDVEKVAMDCATQVSDQQTSADTIRILFYGVPKKLSSRIADAAVDTGMRETLGEVSHGTGEVAIHCADDCRQGKIETRLYASPTFFSTAERRKMGGALLRFRASVPDISRFPIVLHYVSNSGSDVLESVSGSSSRPVIAPVK